MGHVADVTATLCTYRHLFSTINNSSVSAKVTMAQKGAKSKSVHSEPLFNPLLLTTNFGEMTDSVILQRSLNLKSVVLTISSFSRLFQIARSRPDLQQLNQIGDRGPGRRL